MQAKHSIGAFILLLALFVASLHAAAFSYALYWRVRWLDIPMHFLGGALVGALVLWILAFALMRPRTEWLLMTLVAVAAVGIGWEFFEYGAGLTRGEEGYWLDTGRDLALDIVGGISLFALFKRYVR